MYKDGRVMCGDHLLEVGVVVVGVGVVTVDVVVDVGVVAVVVGVVVDVGVVAVAVGVGFVAVCVVAVGFVAVVW